MTPYARRLRVVGLLLLITAQVPPTRSARARRPLDPTPAPLRIDLLHDPGWRLRLVPGIGPRRAARILEARAGWARKGGPEASGAARAPEALLAEALGPRLAARIAATGLIGEEQAGP